jgi:hypothetical protein
MLSFPGVVAVPRPLLHMWARVSTYTNSHSSEHRTPPIEPLISKKVIPYQTRSGAYCPGVSTPKIRSLADSSLTIHITWRIPTVSTIQTFAQTDDVVSSDICDEEREKHNYSRSISTNAYLTGSLIRVTSYLVGCRSFFAPAWVSICGTITSPWTCLQSRQLRFPIRLLTYRQALIRCLSWTWLHALGSIDQLHATLSLHCFDVLYLILQWVDDMFYTPWWVCNMCWKLHSCHISVYYLWVVAQFAWPSG